MHKTQLISLLKHFSPGDMERFGSYLASPYFGCGENLRNLFAEIREHYPDFTHPDFRREKLFEKAGVLQKDYNDSTARNHTAELYDAALRFLSVEGLLSNEKDLTGAVLKELADRNLNEHFLKRAEEIEWNFENKFGADVSYFINRFRIEAYRLNFLISNDLITKHGGPQEAVCRLNKSAAQLVNHFAGELVPLYTNLLALSHSFDIEPDSTLVYKLMERFKMEELEEMTENDNPHSFIFRVYAKMLDAYADIHNNEKYFRFKESLAGHADRFSPDENSSLYFLLIGCCIMKITKGIAFDAELLALYKEMLSNGYHKNSGRKYIYPDFYRAVLTHALKMKDYDWLREFVEKYRTEVAPQERNNMYHFGSAYLQFTTGNYEQCLVHVNKITLDHFIFKYDVKNITLRTFFELGYFEEGLTLVSAYKDMLRKDKVLSSRMKWSFKRFAGFTEKIILCRLGKENIEPGYIRYRLAKAEDVAFKEWISEKLEEMTGKRTG